MKFWKEHQPLRITLITLLFIIGMTLLIVGWKMTATLTGLGIMILGLALLLCGLALYNVTYNY